MPIDLLIIGGSGFIGARTAQIAQSAGLTVACTHLNHPVPPGRPGSPGIAAFRVDALDEHALAGCLAQTQPGAVLYSAISWDLSSMEAQARVSEGGVRALLRAFASSGVAPRLVYLSTNAVFSGSRLLYREDDAPDPEQRSDAYRFYGLGRRAGELAALEGWANTLVARTANVDGLDAWGHLNPRLARLVEPLRAGQPLHRFVDRVISPTLVDNLAEALCEVAQTGFALPPGRVLHLCGCQPITDYDYARALAARLGADPALVQPDHYLPAGSGGVYSIALDTAYTQGLLSTRLVGAAELLKKLRI